MKPLVHLSRIVGLVAVLEFWVMVILWYLDLPMAPQQFFIDSLLLSLASAPFLYLWVIKPYMASLKVETSLVHSSLEKQTVLNRILRLSLADVPLEEILGRIIDEILSVKWLSLKSTGGIWLVEEPGTLVLKAQRGFSQPQQNQCRTIPLGECICGRAALSGEIEFTSHVDEKHERGYEGIIPHGHYCVPIKYSGEVIGVITLYLREGHKRDQREEEFLLSIADITAGIIRRRQTEKALTENEERICYIAYHDYLTGLPNRMLLIDRLNQVIALSRRHELYAAVLFLDLNRFKYINDTLGHPAGDGMLREVAERLRGSLRVTDTIARLGGDEFTIVLQDVQKIENVIHVVEKVFSALSEPFSINGYEFFVTASVGISVFPDDGEDSETLLKNADIAMYRAKDEGIGNHYVLYTPSMNEWTHERLRVEGMLRKALERGEFLLHYQPQVALNSGEITGVEALVRWREPERGLIPPGEFIVVAEDTGLIIPLGEWILRNACMANKAWQDKGLKPSTVAVNLSLRQFKQKDFVGAVARILKETQLDPQCLELELTESILMENAEATIDILRALKEVGIRLTIDDFGTGYSSLEYLRRMPIDMLKIAMPFVRDIAKSPDDASIVTAIINMAHCLNLEVIAEGVETAEQLALLRSLGCDKIQGFLVSRPVPPAEIEEFLKKGSRFVIR